MVLLMLVTIIYMPIVLPFLLQGVEVNPWEIARSLIFLMLLPLTIGLFVKARYDKVADHLQPIMSQASSIALILLLVSALVLNFETMIATIGTGGILAAIIFIVAAFVIGYFLGGPASGTRSVMGLGTAQRNLSAALVVAGQNFADEPNVLVMILVAGLIGLVLLMGAAGELGKRVQSEQAVNTG